jgi:hypothetical protein
LERLGRMQVLVEVGSGALVRENVLEGKDRGRKGKGESEVEE